MSKLSSCGPTALNNIISLNSFRQRSCSVDREPMATVGTENLRFQDTVICRFSAASLALQVIFSGGTTEQHVIAGFGELAAVD